MSESADELALLRQVQRIARLGSWEWRVDTGEIAWSEQLFRIYGFEPGAVKPSLEKFLELVHPDDRERFADALSVLEEGVAKTTSYRMIRPDGSVRWIESCCEPNKDESGRYVRLVGVERDVTDRVLAEAALRESEERYRRIVETSQEGIWLVDGDERTAFVNARMADMLGTTVEDIRARSIYDFIDPDHHEHTRARFAQRRRGRSTHGFELKLRRRDGREIWVLGSGDAVLDGAGQYGGTLAMFVDITERRAAEERARQLAAIVESSNDAIFALSPSGAIVTWNAGAERAYGWTAAEAVGAPAAKLLREAHPGELDACLEKVARGESVPLIETRHGRKDGATLHVTLTVSRLPDAGGAYVGASVIARDVSDRAALRRSEERFKRLVESNLFSIVIGDGTGRIIDASDSFLALLGFDREDLRSGRIRWDTLTPPEYFEVDARVVESVRTKGFCPPYEKEFLRKDGTRVPILMGIAATSGHDQADVEGIGFVLDLTRLKQAEEAVRRTEDQLRQAQKMEAIGRLAGGIAHDFNNILAAIMGYAELGVKKLDAQEPVRASLLEIQAASDRAASLTRQLLAFGRKQVLNPSAALDLNSVVGDMDRMLRRLIGEDVTLEVRLEKDLWPVKADPSQLEQVIVNLAVNARDAMPEGGKLTLETRNIIIEEPRRHPEVGPGSWVVLTVTDGGVGMDRETLARAFEPFFTTKPVGRGTGLGLSTVYGIVKQSGGHITVASEPGRGTRFEIFLPRTEGTPERWQRPTPLAASTGDETILLVEDNNTVRALVRELLEASGYRVLAASHPDEALALSAAHAGRIDVLLTDVIMPGMNGRQLHARLVTQRPGIPVLFMSGHTDGVLQRQGALEPGTAFIQKPFTLAALSHELRRVLASSHEHREAAPR